MSAAENAIDLFICSSILLTQSEKCSQMFFQEYIIVGVLLSHPGGEPWL